MPTQWSLILAAFVTTILLGELLVRLAPTLGFIDLPEARKVHRVPVPRTGGLAMVLGGTLTLVLAWACGLLPWPELPWQTWAAGTGLVLLGGLDDRFSFQPRQKLFVMLGLAFLAAWPWAAGLPGLPSSAWAGALGFVPMVLLLTFWFLAVPNAVNIEDAINGYMGGFTFIVLLALRFRGVETGMALGVLAGFLVLNWPRARHFMGDAGSYGCGFLMAEAILRAGALAHPVLALALTAPISLDVAMGLVRRRRLGMKALDADRSTCPHHLLALAKGSHLLATPPLWLIAIGFAAAAQRPLLAGLLAVAYTGLLLGLNWGLLARPRTAGRDGRPKQLMFVINEAWFFRSQWQPLAEAARAAGYRVRIMGPPAPEAAKLEAAGFEFIPVAMSRKGMNILTELGSLYRIWRVLARERPDLVHMLAVKPVLHGGLAARAAGVPAAVGTFTGLGFLYVSEGTVARIRRWLVERPLRLALGHPRMKVIFQNPEHLATLVNRGVVAADRTVLIVGAGVDIDRFTPQPEPEGLPIVILASRMLRDKGVLEFAGAARILRQRGVPVRLALVGEPDLGNPTSLLRADLESLVAEGNLEWWGFRKDMVKVLQEASVVCLPSYTEGAPTVLIEAASCGRAIIASDIPGCRVVVDHGRNGLLVPVRSVEPLAQAIEALVLDPALRQAMGRAGREKVLSGLSRDQVNFATVSIYAELTGAAAAVPAQVLEHGHAG